MIKFKCKRKILSRGQLPDSVAGIRWYEGFMRRHSTILKRSRGKVQDVNRNLWCTYDNFEKMYSSVYKAMVEAKVVVKLDFDISYDKKGNKVSDSECCFGLPSKYKLIKPENILFVDETGKNTNQKSNGQIGGQRFIVSVDGDDIGYLGSTTDMHFTVLCFTAATRDPVMCAVIFKSEKDIKDIPLSWHYGIDITKTLNAGENDIQLFLNNSRPGEAMSGGPECFFQGQK
jgi:hypothetical protein